MGEVYRARNTRLNRELALKILPPTEPEQLRRFETEACSASVLNHPNILTIYESGSAEGVHFLATELIDGEPLQPKPERTTRALLDDLEDGAKKLTMK